MAINAVTHWIRPFPDPADVFAGDVERSFRHLLPLVSIDLAQVNPQWSGWIHLVNPCEPAEGMIGDRTVRYHNAYLQTNWLAFKLDANDRYELLGDWRYFYLENPELNRPDRRFQREREQGLKAMQKLFASMDKKLHGFSNAVEREREVFPTHESAYAQVQAHYAEQHEAYAMAKRRFLAHGKLLSVNQFPRENANFDREPSSNFLEQLGGPAAGGNWAETDGGIRLMADDEWNDVYPVGPTGNRFHFVAQVPGWHYCKAGADSIILFFEPVERIALITFDWT
ncbi:hypothetical protein J2W49_000941 [Hydrogenophaga palleronii]|uniref:Enolase n=1 Tax=Hydrogenophaga palleronii TaxID=65655 RepID=A0ABU1WI84_9BURK|nr:hypothetical protein [Hydrogenophaga palleronii]MDR7148992.1 hypothetical protein [Hydrogenophaga palleronii]